MRGSCYEIPASFTYGIDMKRKIVTVELVDDFLKTWNETAEWPINRGDINYGMCYQMAVLLRKLHGSKAILWYDAEHCWVEVNGKHYDTDFPDGTTLDTMSKDDLCPRRSRTIKHVCEHWATGGSGPVRHDVIEAILEKQGFKRRNNRNRKAA